MLPEAEIVFLDEVFKCNSAILNALLALLNERHYTSGGKRIECPLISAFGACNEVPSDETLTALFDRFLLRIRSDNLDAYHFNELLEARHPARGPAPARRVAAAPLIAAADLGQLAAMLGAAAELHRRVPEQLQGPRLPDPRRGHQPRATGAWSRCSSSSPRARSSTAERSADASDFFVLKHIWNNEDQAAILEGMVQPLLEAFYREHPDRRRVGALGVGLDALGAEIDRIRQVLTGRRAAERRPALQPAQGARRDQGRAQPSPISRRASSSSAWPAPRGVTQERPVRRTVRRARAGRPAGS